MTTIEKNIPIPDGRRGLYVGVLRKMEIGDSAHFIKIRTTAALHTAAKSLGIKVKTRMEGDGFRVWRIA